MPKYAGLMVALLTMAACGQTTEPELRLDAGVRVVHAAPETSQLEVLLEGERRTALVYAEVSDRFTVASGERRVELRLAGQTAALIDLTQELGSGGRYTVLAAGREGDIHPIVLEDDPAPADTGETRIRFVHAAPTAGPLDVHITDPGDELGGGVTFGGVQFGGATDYIELESGTYRVRATVAGSLVLTIDLPLLVLSSNRVITVVAMDTEGSGPPHGLIVLADDDG
jgi:hypothetical protein